MHSKKLALAGMLALSLVACKKDQAEQTTPTGSTDATNVTSTQPKSSGKRSTFGAFVPADTPYLFGNLETMPNSVKDYHITKSKPIFDAFDSALGQFLSVAQESGEHDNAKTAAAVLGQLRGKISPEGLEDMGFNLNAGFVMYGLGPFPVARMELSSAAKLMETIASMESSAGKQLPTAEHNGQKYWHVTDPDGKIGFYGAIIDNHLAVGILPSNRLNDLLPNLLAQQKPANGLDYRATLGSLNKENDYLPYGSGFFSMVKMVDTVLKGQNSGAQALRELMSLDPTTVSAVCAAEYAALASHMPQMEFGYLDYEKEKIQMHFGLDLDAETAQSLRTLVADSGAFEKDPGSLLAFSLGFKIGPLKDWLISQSDKIAAKPYQCEKLAGLNNAFAGMQGQLQRPLPPFVNNFNGIKLSLDDVDFSGPIPQVNKGYVALNTSNPQMLLGMAQLFVPQFQGLNLTPNGEPQALDLAGIPVPIQNAYISQSDNAIGVSLGDGAQASLNQFLDNGSGNDGTLMTMAYSYDFYINQVMGKFNALRDAQLQQMGDAGMDDDMAMATGMMSISDSLMKAVTEVLDREFTRVKITDNGIESTQTIYLK